jgi:hypothetical protein
MTTETRKLAAEYDMVGKLIAAIREGKAELYIKTRDQWGSDVIESDYLIEEIFPEPTTYLHHIKGDLLMYEADLRCQIIDSLVKESDDAMGLDEIPSDPPELRIFPKDDYRRSYTNEETEDDRR